MKYLILWSILAAFFLLFIKGAGDLNREENEEADRLTEELRDGRR